MCNGNGGGPFSISVRAITSGGSREGSTSAGRVCHHVFRNSLPKRVDNGFASHRVFCSKCLRACVSESVGSRVPGVGRARFLSFVHTTTYEAKRVLGVRSVTTSINVDSSATGE